MDDAIDKLKSEMQQLTDDKNELVDQKYALEEQI